VDAWLNEALSLLSDVQIQWESPTASAVACGFGHGGCWLKAPV